MEWITPNWPAPNNVHALTTLRVGGYSQGVFESLNLALHVDDDPLAVEANRRLLEAEAKLPSAPVWLAQEHGITVIDVGADLCVRPSADPDVRPSAPHADASVCFTPGKVCAVLTADCLPILLCDTQGSRVAAVHAGWRGLAAGVIEAAVKSLQCPTSSLMAWLGPGIGPDAFEVGIDVFKIFGEAGECAFKPCGQKTWKANLYELAILRLKGLGITQISGGSFCTFTEQDRFYSFRRSSKTGRMASIIWLSEPIVSVSL